MAASAFLYRCTALNPKNNNQDLHPLCSHPAVHAYMVQVLGQLHSEAVLTMLLTGAALGHRHCYTV